MNAHFSFFESGRVIVTQPNAPMLIFKNEYGLLEKIGALGFDADDISNILNSAAAKHNGIAWNLIPDQKNNHVFNCRDGRLSFDRDLVTDDDIQIALRHAANKFGQPLTFTGEDPIFTARMARLADDMGIAVFNPELQALIAEHREERRSAKPG